MKQLWNMMGKEEGNLKSKPPQYEPKTKARISVIWSDVKQVCALLAEDAQEHWLSELRTNFPLCAQVEPTQAESVRA